MCDTDEVKRDEQKAIELLEEAYDLISKALDLHSNHLGHCRCNRFLKDENSRNILLSLTEITNDITMCNPYCDSFI